MRSLLRLSRHSASIHCAGGCRSNVELTNTTWSATPHPRFVRSFGTVMKTKTTGTSTFLGLRGYFTKRKPELSEEAPPATGVKAAPTSIEVTPGNGPNRFQFLDVKNLGKEATFHAEGQIISSQNSNSFLTGVYPLGWGHDRDAWVVIPNGA